MNLKPSAGSVCVALILLVAAWVLHGFIEALLAACITAVASWPIYRVFLARMPRCLQRRTAAPLFTFLMAVFVLAPLIFAFAALVTEAHATLLAIAAADRKGIVAPPWLADMPLAGPWLAARWTSEVAHPGTLSLWAERADGAALLSWVHSLGQFAARHLFIVVFTMLMLVFLYQEGESLGLALKHTLRERIGERAEHYLEVASHAIRAAINSMLLVGLFDGCAGWAAYHFAGVPHALTWGAITGALGFVPFLGYVAVAALTLQLATAGAAGTAATSLFLGSLVLLVGDKLVRPAMARKGTHLPFVWILMGCFGGFQVLGLVGLVIGPVALTLSREILTEGLERTVGVRSRAAKRGGLRRRRIRGRFV
jgi:predicted PurR-regulated permease PerM